MLRVRNVPSIIAGTRSRAARAKMRGRCENLDFKGPGTGKGYQPHQETEAIEMPKGRPEEKEKRPVFQRRKRFEKWQQFAHFKSVQVKTPEGNCKRWKTLSPGPIA